MPKKPLTEEQHQAKLAKKRAWYAKKMQDPEWRAKKCAKHNVYHKNRMKTDPAYRKNRYKKLAAYKKLKYQTDPEFRAKNKERNKLFHQKNREKVNAKRRAEYAERHRPIDDAEVDKFVDGMLLAGYKHEPS